MSVVIRYFTTDQEKTCDLKTLGMLGALKTRDDKTSSNLYCNSVLQRKQLLVR